MAKKRYVNTLELRNLGFSEDLIQAALNMEKKGLFDVEPSADLVEITVEACRDLFPVAKKKPALFKRLLNKVFCKR
ncbi:MAG: hypothetical protein KGJ89_02685 [Patescibacteria group bacterium]|nr:hypothetical protein [Patescibacteria group bacterium]MDE2015785.1 hypothetical protein [Patescibacteria group bacterium]MDE2226842.1 hypothetical protein [Patescibacteria group bacterium]